VEVEEEVGQPQIVGSGGAVKKEEEDTCFI